MNRRSFSAMGCELVVESSSPAAGAAIVALFEEREAIFSRFLAGSELSRVNDSGEPAVPVSTTFAAALSTALWAAEVTQGLVVPTLGRALEAAGYDADFAELVPDPRPVDPPSPVDWREVRVLGRLIVRPPGTRLDLNGVVKSMTVDAACALLDGAGFVSAGGDLAVRDAPLTVALPDGGAVRLESGGIATSGSTGRRWLRAGGVQHHLIDPATRRASGSPWSTVTAVGRNCLSADVAAKAGFLLGEAGPAWLDRRGVAARFLAGSEVVENRAWSASLEPVAA